MSQQFATTADLVRHLETTHGGTFERQPQEDGRVIARFVKPDGEVITGRGQTTALAVTQLATKLESYANATRGSI